MTFPWTCLDCDTIFESPEELNNETLTNKSDHTEHAKLHYGHRHHTPVLLGNFVEVRKHVADTLHLFLNLIKELLEESVMRFATTQALVDAVAAILQELVGCYIQVTKQSARQDLDYEKKPKLIGRECKSMFDHYEPVMLTGLDRDDEDFVYFVACWEALKALWNAFCERLSLEEQTKEGRLRKSLEIKALAKAYIVAFSTALSEDKVPVYAHIAYEHFPEWVEEYGDVIDLSTEGLEHFHSVRKRDLHSMNNRRKMGEKNKTSRTSQSMKVHVAKKKISKHKAARVDRQYERKKILRATAAMATTGAC
ncbi:hypothetical protein CYMTET_41617 [Cymbomonas tetramitiformis]|uniref:Uncharacterized protein n=1 Tax=Cymbomonas tetramitiformis TaxID=36881 RepID=A0AAE0C5Q3_9CHLO|nr:hypothetical protein CYMTET_41617 [Cymbomonas tetramitiformis]